MLQRLLRGWLGWFLNIHLPSAHSEEICWCIGTKRELKLPDTFMTKSKAMEELRAAEDYFKEMLDALKRQDTENPD